jgi:hypothetical protein
MPRHRSRLRLGTGLSLTRRDLVVRAGPGGRVDLDPAVRDLADLGDRAARGLGRDLEDPVDPEGIRHRVGRAAPVGLADPAGLALAGRVDQGMDRVDPADPVGLGDLDLGGLAELGLADRADRADPTDRVDPAVRLDRQQRRGRPGVLSTGVVPRWVAPGMCRTASAPPTTVHRLHRENMDGAGMVGLHPERRRLSGTDRRPPVAGAVLRLPAVGTARGTVRRATSGGRSVISGRSITTGTTRSRCLTRCSVDGASGSSVSGFRCTDTSQNSWPPDLAVAGPEASGVC